MATVVGGVSLEVLAAAGLLAVPGFLSEAGCDDLRNAMADAASVKTTIARDGQDHVLDERTRRTRGMIMPPALRQDVEQRLADLRPQLAEHFGVALDHPEPPQFLAYGKSDFFRPHADSSDDPALAEFLRRRRVSVVIFLGRQTRLPAPGSYCGGELVFFRLPGLSGPEAVRAPVWGRPGLLIAFPSAQLHEVAPITHGFRGSVVSWFPAHGE
jgi:predicted 2-oxoglutarate/Fe(II)-dependent dioxygenase YbiX